MAVEDLRWFQAQRPEKFLNMNILSTTISLSSSRSISLPHLIASFLSSLVFLLVRAGPQSPNSPRCFNHVFSNFYFFYFEIKLYLIFLNYFNMLILKLNFKNNKKYYFNIFLEYYKDMWSTKNKIKNL